ncbi:MAG TPA: tripartite tricarboxylate transporter substrate binding protein [Xanthobacteraceae bacterium]|jgi:tripartite-type tricarboxylate transporter receptor subunit TctC
MTRRLVGRAAVTAAWSLPTLLACCLIAALRAPDAQAQADLYPSRAVKIIADSAAGSTPDVVLRLLADRLGQLWGQQVLVVNYPGAGGSIGARNAAESAPDGYTLYMPVLSTFVSLPGAAANLPVKVPRDFIAIGFAAENPMFIAVNPSLGIASLADLISRARKAPGELSYAVTGVGRLTHLTGELLQIKAAIQLLTVPYTGGPAHAFSDVMSGRVAFIIEGYSGIAGAIQSGSLKAIAVASAQRLPEFPNLPTVAETIPGFQATGWQVLVAPLGTPDAIIRAVSEDLRKVISDQEFQKTIAQRGSYARAMTPAETTAFVQAQQQMWQPVLDRLPGKH